jgi:predicted ATPase/class 3 adenylate cyclase/Tfp pilus assembly protein PilF
MGLGEDSCAMIVRSAGKICPMDEVEQIRQAIAALEGQRAVLGDVIVETALGPLREKLAALQNLAVAEPGRVGGIPGVFGEQRKLVTILFADLVGFTAMSERMDPEEIRDLTGAYFDRWVTAIETHGGTVEKFIGDAVMAVFGLKTAGESEPENAIRAALQMRELLKQLQREEPGNEPLANLRMRVGIHTGPVVVSWMGERKGQDFIVVGDSVNLASRLQALAPVNGILISQATYRHVRGVFSVQVVEPVLVKGKRDPLQVYVVLQETPPAFRETARGIEGVDAAMIGRQAELSHLQAVFQGVVDSRECRLVTIFGEAGLGKSRLLLEFDDWLGLQTDHVLFKGRASPTTQNAPYRLLRDLFAARFTIHDSDPPQVARAGLEKGIWEVLREAIPPAGPPGSPGGFPAERPGQPDERRLVQLKTHFIARLLGFEIGPSDFLPLDDPRQIQELGLAYLVEFFRALAGKIPLVMLLEDLHWADDSTLELLLRLARALAHSPLLILGTARPALAERRPEWGRELAFASRLDLEPLSQADSERLVREIMQKASELPPELTALVVRNAEGVPFYVEELIKMLIDDGVIDGRADVWRVDASRLASVRVPATLIEVLQARFDSLSAREKALLQRAAVVGRTFWDQAVSFISARGAPDLPASPWQQAALVSAPEDGALLAQLQKRELIYQRDHSALEETREFFFKHALLRDVTYESLLKRYRRMYHAYTAQWLETVVGRSQRADEYATMIAEHYDLASESGSPLLAASWYIRAARSAAQRYANQPALRLYQRGLELLPETRLEQRYEVHLGQVEIYALLGDRPLQLHTLQAMDALLNWICEAEQPLLDPVAAERLKAETRICWTTYYNTTGDYHQAAASASQAVELARTIGDVLFEIRGKNAWATACRYLSDYPTARQLYLDAKSLAEGLAESPAAGAERRGAGAESRGVAAVSDQSSVDPTSGLLAQRRPGVSLLLADALLGLGVVCEIQAEYTQARQYLEQALALYRQLHHLMGESRALNSLGVVANNQYDLEAGQKYYEQALEIKHLMGDRYGEGVALVNLGVIAERRHKLETAVELFQQSLEICQDIQDEEGIEAALIGLGNNYHSLGDYQQARQVFEQALVISQEIGDRQGEADILTSLGELHNQLGQPETGREYCRQSIRLTEQIGAPSEAGYAWFFLGRALELLGEPEAARQAYRRSLEIRQELGQTSLVVDSQAGLARAQLSLGDRTRALESARAVFEAVRSPDFEHLSQPVRVCLTCYRILSADQPELARQVLQRGYAFVQRVAAEMRNTEFKKSFLERVPENLELRALVIA